MSVAAFLRRERGRHSASRWNFLFLLAFSFLLAGRLGGRFRRLFSRLSLFRLLLGVPGQDHLAGDLDGPAEGAEESCNQLDPLHDPHGSEDDDQERNGPGSEGEEQQEDRAEDLR